MRSDPIERLIDQSVVRAGRFLVEQTRSAANVVLAAHEHADAVLTLTLSGGCEEIAGKKQIVRRSDVAVVHPAGSHRQSRFLADTESLRVVLPGALDPHVLVWVRSPRFRDSAHAIQRELAKRRPGWELIVEGLLLHTLGLVRRLPDHSSRPPWVDELETLIRNRDVASTSEAALRLGISASQIARQFRKHTGLSIGDYERTIRLQWAGDQLTTTDKRVAAIAIEAGFFDQSHFTRAFMAAMRISPTDYRRLWRS